jgi:hypothetical protein
MSDIAPSNSASQSLVNSRSGNVELRHALNQLVEPSIPGKRKQRMTVTCKLCRRTITINASTLATAKTHMKTYHKNQFEIALSGGEFDEDNAGIITIETAFQQNFKKEGFRKLLWEWIVETIHL